MELATIVQFFAYIAIYVIFAKVIYILFAKIFLLLPKDVQEKVLKDAVIFRQRIDEAWKKRKLRT